MDRTGQGSFQETAVVQFYSLLVKSDDRRIILYTPFEPTDVTLGNSWLWNNTPFQHKALEVFMFLFKACARYFVFWIRIFLTYDLMIDRLGDKISFFTSGNGAKLALFILNMIKSMRNIRASGILQSLNTI